MAKLIYCKSEKRTVLNKVNFETNLEQDKSRDGNSTDGERKTDYVDYVDYGTPYGDCARG